MASKTFSMTCSDGITRQFIRTEAQGRRPRNMTKWNGYLSKDDLKALELAAAPPYITVSSMIQVAVSNYVRTQLVNT